MKQRTDLRIRVASVAVMAAAVALALGGGTACSSEEDCVSSREYFSTQVYGKALASCNGCHSPGGTADQKGAKFKIFRETYPDFVTANIESMRKYAALEVNGTPLLLEKPLGKEGHGGGAVLKEDSEEYEILTQFVEDLKAGKEKTCSDNDRLGVQYTSNRETYRKAALTLAGRFPTDAEFAAASSDAGLDEAILKLTQEELFYDRLREIWNDALLTERRLDASVGDTFNNGRELFDDQVPGYTTENRNWATLSVTQEPLRFIEYVVRNNLPFSDVVTANYLVANPYTARLYGVPHDKPISGDSFLEWKRVDFSPVQNQVRDNAPRLIGQPTAGILSTPAFLHRWETTPTNKGRKRARIVLKNFLATDIFKFAQRPVDSTALTSVQNPTSNSAECSVCHTVIDPIAGGFRGFSEDNRLARFNPDDKWHDDMRPPGFNGVDMPPTNYGNALMWLGAQIPADPRFGISIAQVMYRGIVGDEPLSFPTDKSAGDYNDRVRAYTEQNDWFVKVGRDFAATKFDLRRLVVAIVKSPYFRAKSGDPGKDALHDGLGQGRLLTPEMLGRKYRATTGLYYFNFEAATNDVQRSRDGFLKSDLIDDRDWRLVYGGIDSSDVTKRAETMSPIMAATSQYTASIVACRATTFDFTKAPDARRLFRFVDLNTVPFTPRANKDVALVPVPESEKKIRENIQFLFWRLLGETVEVNSLEVNKAYSLFVDVWKDLEETELTAGNNKGLSNYRCVAEVDYDAPVKFEQRDGRNVPVFPRLAERPDKAPYQAGMRLDRDENFTVRSWQAVMTYLLMDYKFTHE
jgi:hypothetical protein